MNPHQVSDVTRQLIERDQRGLKKYGTNLDRTDLSLSDWLQHMAEELLDAAGYALAAKRKLNDKPRPGNGPPYRNPPPPASERPPFRSVPGEAALRQSGEAVRVVRMSDALDAFCLVAEGASSAEVWNALDAKSFRHAAPPATSGLVEGPAPRNRTEAAALAKVALAYLGVIDAHIDAAIARCETNAAHDKRGAE